MEGPNQKKMGLKDLWPRSRPWDRKAPIRIAATITMVTLPSMMGVRLHLEAAADSASRVLFLASFP